MSRSLRWVCAIAVVLACSSDPEVMSLSSTTQSARADGKSAITLEAKITKGGKAVDRGNVTFTSNLEGTAFSPIETGAQPSPEQQTTNVPVMGGTANAKLYSITKGAVKLTATFKDDVMGVTDKKELDLTFTGAATDVASFDYEGSDPAVVPLGGTATVTFLAKDSQGKPASNVEVTFTVAPAGTATIEPTNAKSGVDGKVRTTLTAGSIAGTVKVTATSGAVSKNSDAIAISGGGINAKNLTLGCVHYSIGGFEVFGLEMKCTVFGSDYSGAFVPNSQVIFMTEAGGVPASQAFSEADNGGGAAVFTYRTQCQYPRDVPPLGAASGDMGEPCQFWNQCKAQPGYESRTACNPRDGWANLVAITTGSEAFTDRNGNLKWDAGEPFVDLPEPFVDNNDNGTRDADEDFYDANKDNVWNDKNGKWDDNTAIWASVTITWTRGPKHVDIVPGNTQSYPHCSSTVYTVTISDLNFNAPTATGGDNGLLAECTGNCSVLKTSAYDDGGGGIGNSGPAVVTVNVGDGHGVSGCGDSPGAGSYSVSFSLKRTLDIDSGTSLSQVTDLIDGLAKPDAAPRTGVFQ